MTVIFSCSICICLAKISLYFFNWTIENMKKGKRKDKYPYLFHMATQLGTTSFSTSSIYFTLHIHISFAHKLFTVHLFFLIFLQSHSIHFALIFFYCDFDFIFNPPALFCFDLTPLTPTFWQLAQIIFLVIYILHTCR